MILLDGGMGQELLKRSPDAPTPLWSARVMLDHPELVTAAHLDFIRAGARVITVNAYSATRCRLSKHGLEDEYARLQRLACELAARARDESGEDVAIAGCLSPFHWSYRPELTGSSEENAPLYAESAAIQAPFVDLILCETMSSADEAKGAVMGAATTGKPIWVSWSVDDTDGTRLRSGEPLADAPKVLDGLPVAAKLVNCSMPEAVQQAAPVLAAMGGPWGAYANGFTAIPSAFTPGTTADIIGARHDLTPAAYADYAMRWAELGAAMVGGCCEISPAHIAALRDRLTAQGHEIRGAA